MIEKKEEERKDIISDNNLSEQHQLIHIEKSNHTIPTKYDITTMNNDLEKIENNPFVGISESAFSKEIQKKLMEKIPEEEIQIRPDGIIFLPEIKYRQRLDEAFGIGAWALRRVSITQEKTNEKIIVYFDGILYIYGRYIAQAIGEQEYFANNKEMTYATAAESAKSNCLMRCCKDVGIARELWDIKFIEEWKKKYAIAVWCTYIGNGINNNKTKLLWRKKNSPPFLYPYKEMLNDNDIKNTEKMENVQNSKNKDII